MSDMSETKSDPIEEFFSDYANYQVDLFDDGDLGESVATEISGFYVECVRTRTDGVGMAYYLKIVPLAGERGILGEHFSERDYSNSTLYRFQTREGMLAAYMRFIEVAADFDAP